MDTAALIAIDWGTTSARAYRLDGAGHIVGERSAPLGIQTVRDGAFAAAQTAILGAWAEDTAPRLACGMIGSRQGWIEAPYCQCPAELSALAHVLTRTPDGALLIVPGLTCRDGAGVPDVMRGEETQILGTTAGDDAAGLSRSLVVLPGTHSKWAIVAGTRIETFATFMTGELYAVLRNHSILGRMMAGDGAVGDVRSPAFMRGVERSLDSGSTGAALLHDLFGARTLALCGELAPVQAADYLSGLLIGNELREGHAWAMGRGAAGARTVLVGVPALTERYASAFAALGIATHPGPINAAADGLWRIAQQSGLVPTHRSMTA